MKKAFGTLPNGQQATLYTISAGGITARVTDYGATLVSLLVPDKEGNVADVVLGYDDVNAYATSEGYLGSTVGRNCNRVGNASFPIGEKVYHMTPNEGPHNLHSGPSGYSHRLWELEYHRENAVSFRLESPHMDQGFPGNAVIRVTYSIDSLLHQLNIAYDAMSDRETVMNLTNHSYFNLAGHQNTSLAMDQELILPARHFTPDDAENIPTGEKRPVDGTPMDFRAPKAIGRDIDLEYDALRLQGGYDHNYEVFTSPCAVLRDPTSGRTMQVYTDRPGIQFYSGNYLNNPGKEGVFYPKRSGVCLETQYYPDSLNKPDWEKPILPANTPMHSTTSLRFLY